MQHSKPTIKEIITSSTDLKCEIDINDIIVCIKSVTSETTNGLDTIILCNIRVCKNNVMIVRIGYNIDFMMNLNQIQIFNGQRNGELSLVLKSDRRAHIPQVRDRTRIKVLAKIYLNTKFNHLNISRYINVVNMSAKEGITGIYFDFYDKGRGTSPISDPNDFKYNLSLSFWLVLAGF